MRLSNTSRKPFLHCSRVLRLKTRLSTGRGVISPSKNYLVQCSAQRSPDEDTLEERSDKLSAAFDTMEKQLGDTHYFSGDDIGMVDIAWLPLLHRADVIERRSGYDFHRRPAQDEGLAGTTPGNRPSRTIRSQPDFEDAFSDVLSFRRNRPRKRRTGSRPAGRRHLDTGCLLLARFTFTRKRFDRRTSVINADGRLRWSPDA